MKKIISVVGARPNFMKIAPIHRAFKRYPDTIRHLICHTGQHYDANMSKVFFEDLELPHPDFYLGVGGGSHAIQTANIMIEFEKILLSEQPDVILVVGDVNSTIACTLTAAKLHIPSVHVEAGLRSFDRTMPEEINRILTDSIADYLFVTEQSGLDHLRHEGIPDEKVFLVGNCMIDSVAAYLPKSKQSDIHRQLGLESVDYVLATLHRPSNVDEQQRAEEMVQMLSAVADQRKIVFPVHPRTRKNFDQFGILTRLHPNIILTDPIGYIDFLALIAKAELILTDSGGIQEESTYLGVQCITLRTSTERPSTVELGTNQLLGENLEEALQATWRVLSGIKKEGTIPPYWDGRAAERIVEILVSKLT